MDCCQDHLEAELGPWDGPALDHPLFDAHVHVGMSDTGQLYYGKLTGDEFVSLVKAAGLTKALVFPPTIDSGYRKANYALAQWCKDVGQGMRPLARVGGKHIGWTEPELWLLRRKLRRLIGSRELDLSPEDIDDFAGLKILPHLDGLPADEILEAVNAREMPVLTHGGKFVPADFVEKAVLPRVKGPVVIAHLGAFPDREEDLRAAVDLAKRNPRVYLDTSGIWIADFLRYAINAVPEKIIFGSDCPLTHPRVAWGLIRALVKRDDVLEDIAWRTAETVYG